MEGGQTHKLIAIGNHVDCCMSRIVAMNAEEPEGEVLGTSTPCKDYEISLFDLLRCFGSSPIAGLFRFLLSFVLIHLLLLCEHLF